MEQQPDPAPAPEAGTVTATSATTPARPPKVSNCKENDEPSVRKDREEWSEAAISTLIDAYTAKYGQLNGKGLRSKDWAEVVDTVNSNQKSAKTVEHCRNKMDTLTKRYKSEKKNKLSGIESSWPWYDKMEIIRGCSPGKSVTTPSAPTTTSTPTTTMAGSNKTPQAGPAKEKLNVRAKRGKKTQALDDLPPAIPSESFGQTEKNTKEGTYSSVKLGAPAAAGLSYSSKVDGAPHANFKPDVPAGVVNFSTIAHQNLHASVPAWHNSAPSVAATVAAVAHNSIPQVAAAAAAARAACEQVTSNEGSSDNLAKSITELAGSLKIAAGNLASSINGFTEVYARVEIAKMEMLKELELKRMQMQMDTAELLRGSSKRKRDSSSDAE